MEPLDLTLIPWAQGVASSNLAAPTNHLPLLQADKGRAVTLNGFLNPATHGKTQQDEAGKQRRAFDRFRSRRHQADIVKEGEARIVDGSENERIGSGTHDRRRELLIHVHMPGTKHLRV